VAHPQIAVFARLATGGEAPKRLIYGQPTLLSRTMHDVRYHTVRDEIYVTNPFAQAILAFRGDADAQASPVRIIQGPKTQLGGIDTLEVDSVNDEIIVPDGNGFKVFPAGGNGDVAPLRTVTPGGGRNAQWGVGSGIAVDYVHNVIATDGSVRGDLEAKYPTVTQEGLRTNRNSILIFDRLADGEAMPLRVIRGEKTGIFGIRQMQIYPKGGWVIIAQITEGNIPIPDGTFVGVWSIYDDGNVAPRWRIDGKPSNVMLKPRGVTLNPNHKELIVSDMRLNSVLTFAFPELFDQEAKRPQ
jgi:hypothetical protein